jgi:hypothetical protein
MRLSNKSLWQYCLPLQKPYYKMKKIILVICCTFLFTTLFAQTKISVDSASQYIGKLVTVCSQVFGIKATEKVVLINLGAAYPASPLTIAILAKDFSNFTTPPQELYNNKKLCVIGTVELFKGKAEIIVHKPEEITIEK